MSTTSGSLAPSRTKASPNRAPRRLNPDEASRSLAVTSNGKTDSARSTDPVAPDMFSRGPRVSRCSASSPNEASTRERSTGASSSPNAAPSSKSPTRTSPWTSNESSKTSPRKVSNDRFKDSPARNPVALNSPASASPTMLTEPRTDPLDRSTAPHPGAYSIVKSPSHRRPARSGAKGLEVAGIARLPKICASRRSSVENGSTSSSSTPSRAVPLKSPERTSHRGSLLDSRKNSPLVIRRTSSRTPLGTALSSTLLLSRRPLRCETRTSRQRCAPPGHSSPSARIKWAPAIREIAWSAASSATDWENRSTRASSCSLRCFSSARASPWRSSFPRVSASRCARSRSTAYAAVSAPAISVAATTTGLARLSVAVSRKSCAPNAKRSSKAYVETSPSTTARTKGINGARRSHASSVVVAPLVDGGRCTERAASTVTTTRRTHSAPETTAVQAVIGKLISQPSARLRGGAHTGALAGACRVGPLGLKTPEPVEPPCHAAGRSRYPAHQLPPVQVQAREVP